MPAHRLSASSTALAEYCLYWARADVERPKTRRRWHVNTAIHFAIAHTIATRETECAFEDARHPDAILSNEDVEFVRVTHETWLREWYEHHSHEDWKTEVAVGVDPITREVRDVPRNGKHRDYSSLGESFIPGTADIVRFDAATSTVYVLDWKSGVSYDLAARPAVDNKQLHTLAVAFALRYGAKHAEVSIAKVRPSRVAVDEGELTIIDIEEHRLWLIETLERLKEAPQAIDGPHCYALFCDHYGTCPATKGKLALVEPSAAVLDDKRHLPIVDDPISIQSVEHARYQYETLRAAQAAVEIRMAACWNAIRQWADDHGGIPLDKSVWKRVNQNRESIDLAVVGATNALEHTLGPVWMGAVEMSTSKKLIEDTARGIAVERAKAGEKITIKAVKDGVLAALRAVGAVKSTAIVRYEEVEIEAPTLPESK